MSCCALTIRNPRLRHELQTNTAKQVLMTFLGCYQRGIHTISHILLHNLSILSCLSYLQRISCLFLLIPIKISTFVGLLSKKGLLSHIIYFEMNFQEGRTTDNPRSFQPQPQYRPIPSSFQMRPGNQNSQYGSERQLNIPNNMPKSNFNLKDYSFQTKEYYRPPQNTTTAPLTFNLISPVKTKVKKPHRPISKVTKSFVNPFTKQLEDEFFKEEHNRVNIANLQDLSKTTSTLMGQSFFNTQQIHTQPSLDNLYPPSKPYPDYDHNRSLQNAQSLQNFLKKNESQSRIFNNSNSYTNINGGYHYQHEVSSARQRDKQQANDRTFLMIEIKSQRETIETLQSEVGRLNQEIKVWKIGEGNKKDMELRNSRKENKYEKKQYELQCQQNSKLLTQIEEMERDMKGKQELHKYFEQQCNIYLDSYNKIHQEFESYKKSQLEDKQRNDQIVDILKKETKYLELELDSFRATDKALREELIQLRKNMQLQSQRIAEQSTNYNIDRSQINVLTTRLENLQGKYEKMMHSLCENQIRFHNVQEEREKQRDQLNFKIKEASVRQQQLVRDNEELVKQITQVSNEKVRISNENSEIKSTLLEKSSYFQSQYDTASQEVKDARRLLEEKTAKIHELNFKVQITLKEKEQTQTLLIDLQGKHDNILLNSQQYLHKVQQIEKLAEHYKSELEKVQLQYSSIESQYNQLKKANQQIQSENATKSEELKKLTAEISLLHSQTKEFERKDAIHKNTLLEVQATQKRLENLEKSYSFLKAKIAQYQQIANQHKDCEGQHNKLKQKLVSLQHQQAQLKQKLTKSEERQQSYEKISQQKQVLKAQQQRLNKTLEEKNLILQQNNAELSIIKETSARIQSQYSLTNKQYFLLKDNYEAQSLHYKDIESHLIQNQFNYTILQRQFNQYLVKYKEIQEECYNMKHLNTELQSSLRQAISGNEKSRRVIGSLRAEDSEKEKQENELEEWKNEKDQYERKIKCLQGEKDKIVNDMQVLMEGHQEELAKIQERCKEIDNKNAKVIQQLASANLKYSILSQYHQNQQREILSLTSFIKSKEVEILSKQQQNILSYKQIQSLNAQITNLQEKIQLLQETLKIQSSKQQSLRQEITSLMLIIEQNQKRHENQKSQLNATISALTSRYLNEDQENKKIIDELKQTVLALQQRQQYPKSIQGQEYIQNIDKQEEGQKIQRLSRQWQSQTNFRQDDSLNSSIKLKQFLSANDLQQPQQISYIQMDREGVIYLCQILQINIKNGNILNQIVVKVQTHLTQLNLSKRVVQSHRKLLDTFGIPQSPSSDDLLTQEITSFKENLAIVLEKLHQQEFQHQALKNQYHHLAIVKEAEMMKNQRYMHEIAMLNELTEELNELVIRLTASLCNKKMQITEALALTKGEIPNTNSTSLIKSEKFVTVKSFPHLPSDPEFQDL